MSWGKDDPTVDMEALIDRETFVEMQELVERRIFISRDLLRYIAELIRNARSDERVEAGPSPRGGIALMKVGKANALLEGRDFVLPDDVKAYAVDALAHRIVIKPEYAFEGISGEEIVREALEKTPVPKEAGER